MKYADQNDAPELEDSTSKNLARWVWDREALSRTGAAASRVVRGRKSLHIGPQCPGRADACQSLTPAA
jgi:hypothetical protein